MDRVSKPVVVVKGYMGSVIRGQKTHLRDHPKIAPTRTRGDITRFSSASARRLRETMVLGRPRPDCVPVGLCLTIPGEILPDADVRHLWHDFVLAVRSSLPHVAVIWRIELQQRKQPHWHLLAYTRREVVCGVVLPDQFAPDVRRLRDIWERVALKYAKVVSWQSDAFLKHGVDIKPLSGASATGKIHYLADHESKHKREQLGWRGRQWGVINRAALTFDGKVVCVMDEDAHKAAARQFRRLQEHIRADNAGRDKYHQTYTGGGVCPNGSVNRSMFGDDERRWMRCVEMVSRNSCPFTESDLRP